MWEKFKPIEIAPEVMDRLNRVRHDNHDATNDEKTWFENGRKNDAAFNISEKRYLDMLKSRTSQ